MTPNEYLDALLKSQRLSEDQLKTLESHREEVEEILRDEFGDEPKIRYGGSKAKNTMISESYDLDIVCYFPHDTDKTIKQIYDEVWFCLESHYSIQKKTSAIRILKIADGVETDYHIDVVPGKYLKGDIGDAFLHVNGLDRERIQTNIDTHIALISESGCRETIKLLKLWKKRNKISFKTFVLEIFTVESLAGQKYKDDLKKSFLHVMSDLVEKIETICLEDPANSNNIVSDSLTKAEKKLIKDEALKTSTNLNDDSRDEIVGWKIVFDEDTMDTNHIGPTIIVKPPRPWTQS